MVPALRPAGRPGLLRAMSAALVLLADHELAASTLAARVAGMVRGAGEAIFAVARTAGWIAHALEAYAGDRPLRPRAVYTGGEGRD